MAYVLQSFFEVCYTCCVMNEANEENRFLSGEKIEEDVTEGSLRPQKLAEFIGQAKLKKNIGKLRWLLAHAMIGFQIKDINCSLIASGLSLQDQTEWEFV